jgi:hypothetical protein
LSSRFFSFIDFLGHKSNSLLELSKSSLRRREKRRPCTVQTGSFVASGMKNQQTKRSVRYDQTGDDSARFCTDDAQAPYGTMKKKCLESGKGDEVNLDEDLLPPLPT